MDKSYMVQQMVEALVRVGQYQADHQQMHRTVLQLVKNQDVSDQASVVQVFRNAGALVDPSKSNEEILELCLAAIQPIPFDGHGSTTKPDNRGPSVALTSLCHADPGELLNDRYKVVKHLGKGAMGVVLLCFDEKLSRHVALKQVQVYDPQELLRFRQEAEIMAKIDSPHVINIYEVLTSPPGIVMKAVDGVELKEHCRVTGACIDKQLILGIVRGVDACHQANVIHRDLKPSNIMVEQGSNAIIMDLGLGKQYVQENQDRLSLTEEGGMLGTPAFMPYEQLMGLNDQVGPWSDVFSLGVVLFSMVTGQHPYTTDGLIGICNAHNKAHEAGSYPGVAKQLEQQGVDFTLREIIVKAMSPRAAGRYRNAGEMLADLTAYFDEEFDRLAKLRARQLFLKWAAPILLVLLTALSAGLFGLVKTVSSERDAQQRAAAAAHEQFLSEERAKSEVEKRLQLEQQQRRTSEVIAMASSLISRSEWEEVVALLEPLVSKQPDLPRPRRMLAQALDILQSPKRIQHYVWLAEHSDGDMQQDYYLQAIIGVDIMDDTTPEAVEQQLRVANPIFEAMTGLHRDVADVMMRLYRANLLRRQGGEQEAMRGFRAAFALVPRLATREHSTWTTLFMVGFYQSLKSDWVGAYHAMNAAATLNPEYHMTLFWRQRCRRFVARGLQGADTHRAYGELLASLQDLERLQVMRPNDPVVDIDHAETLLEISVPRIRSDQRLRLPRIQQAIRLMESCRESLEEQRYRPLAEQVYLVRAKAYALRWRLNQNEQDRSRARSSLERARTYQSDKSHEQIYTRVEMLIR